MKRQPFLPFFILAGILLFINYSGMGQLLFEENFSYPAGDPITNWGWSAHSGAGTQPITVNAGGLNFTGYPGSGTGNAALLDNTGEDDNHVFPVQSAGTVYTAFMVNVTTTAAGYFLHLGGDPVGTTFRGKVFMDATNHFGLSMGSNTGTFASSAYNPGSTYVLVLKYEVVAGAANDIVSLFIFDSTLPSTEPGTPSVGPLTDAAMSDINPGSVALRQFLSTQNLIIDGIRVGTAWSDILPASIAPPTVQAQDITFGSVTANGMTASWTNGNGSKRVALINTTNSFTPPADGTDPVASPVYGGTGEQVVFNGSGNTVSLSGLSGNTTYWLRVFEYNGAGSSTRFLTVTATLNPNSQATSAVMTAPLVDSPVVSSIGSTTALLGGTVTGDGGSPLTERGTVWGTAPGVTLSDNKLAEGGLLTGPFSHIRSALPAQTLVYFKAYATNSIGTTLTSESSFVTLSAEPSSHVTGFTASPSGNTSIALNWTAASPGATGYLIIGKQGATPPSGAPVDGTAYSAGSVLGDGTVAALVTPGSALATTIAGLSSGTAYAYSIFPFAWNGTDPVTYNYLTSPVVPSATATTTGSPSVVYTWTGPDNGSWGSAANWTPARSTPTVSDILQFNDGTTKTVTGLTTQTIAQLLLSNNTTVNLQSASAATLTISGSAGDDLVIGTGCSLNLNAVNAITLSVATAATATISGNVKFTSTATTAHRLLAADPGGIRFNNGAIFTAGPFFSGNAFGTSSLGSVVFSSGSAYIQQAGSNPFGAAQPNSVVVFQPGSLFRVTANLTPSFSGRTYANFEMDAPGITLSPSGTNPVFIENLTITNGTFNYNMSGPTSGVHEIRGNILVQSGAILNFSPAAASTVSLKGTSSQSITVNGTLTFNNLVTLEADNAAGIILNSPVTLNGNLKLTTGMLTLGANNLTLGTASLIQGTPSAAAMIVATGSGQLRKNFPTGFTGSFTFPTGDNTGTPEFSPVILDFQSGTFATGNYAGVNLLNIKYPLDPNTTNYLKRYWNIAVSGITSFTCDAVCQYVPADVNGDENGMYAMQVLPAPFTSFGPAAAAQHQLVFPGLTGPGTFTGTQPKPAATTLPATSVDATTATVNGEITGFFNPTQVSFEYGLTTSYGTSVPGSPAMVNGGVSQPVLANLTGLVQNTTYHFRVTGASPSGTTYGNDLTFTTTCPAPAAAGAISGPAAVCPNGSGYVYSVASIPYAATYLWSLPAGASITSGANTNSITVSFSGTAASGNITVTGSSVCGSGSASPPYGVTVVAPPVPTVSGPASACINSGGHVYSTEPGMTAYQWSVTPGGSITAGTGTSSVTVTWSGSGAQSVSVGYTNSAGCVSVSPTTYPVAVSPLPMPTITGPAVVCANAANIVYTTEPGMSNYDWNVSIGGFITAGAGTNSVTVSWPYAGNRTVSVSYSNATGCATASPTVYNVTINPAAVPTIGSSNNPCLNSTNNQYITNSGMANYTWNVSPGGTITSGTGTNTINVTWNAIGNQWVSVGFTNSYGCTTVTPTVYNLFVNPAPGAAGSISGPASLCTGTQGVAYSCSDIQNAVTYQWTLPAGATIASGAGTNQITVNFSTAATSGNLKVAGVNECGQGQTSPPFPVTIHPIPPAPVISASGAVLTSSAPSGNQWFFQGTAIPGATAQTYTATLTGTYTCQVTLNGCTSPLSNPVYIVIAGLPVADNPVFSLHPVPTEGPFTLTLSASAGLLTSVTVYDLTGKPVYTSGPVRPSTKELFVDPGQLPNGIYSVIVQTETGQSVRKLVIRR